MRLQQSELEHFAHAIAYQCLPATCHIVTVVKSTAGSRSRHCFGCVKCQEWTYVMQCVYVVVTGASYIDDVLLKERMKLSVILRRLTSSAN